ncbi:MAG: hypothetical protein IPJ61_00465 [Tessaracoccus sp.]|uniref:hypothetical protein n=1 Tax=Tessaracoccus sp. TaxID=1971211 RepID=UPI001ED42F1E|nr:hypothetical protein [Tessaracoccus sp.]MBK7819568.1 hypothetical protein [Tessaracoccus sp.]
MAVVLAGALVAAGLALLHPTVRPAEVPPSAPPTPSVEPWRLPPVSWDPLPEPDPTSPLFAAQSAAINDVVPVALTGCPAPARVREVGEWQAAVQAQWHCVHAGWRPVLVEFGLSTLEPAVHFFVGDGSDSECGHVDAPAFYCAVGTGSVHFGDGHLAQAQSWDLAVAEMVTHEYGHHLQALFGITANRLVARGGLQLERRSELQAVCWSAAMTRRNDAVTFDQAAYDGWIARLDRMREDRAHGTRASLRYWGTRGLYAETMGDCNTWVVESDAVR